VISLLNRIGAWWKHVGCVLLSWGPHGVFVLAILDSAGLPVVGGVDLLLITVAMNTPRYALLAAIYATIGSLAGSLVLFAIARKGGEAFLAKQLSTKRGKQLHLWFEQYGLVTVFIPALSPIPLPMKIPVFCAGALEVHWSYFIGVVLAARAIRYFGLAYLGMRYGSEAFLWIQKHLFEIGIGILILAAGTIVAIRLVRRAQRRRRMHHASA
jgi:membrane protein YqaA with SNARE-associated domain